MAGSDRDPDFPQRLGRYEVLLPIASGGMARVFLACSTGLGGFEREVAVKITHDYLEHNHQFFTALIDEARLAGRIRHPNVVSVLDVGEAPEGVYIVMDYVEGESLAGLQRMLTAKGAWIPLDVSLRILDDVLSGLHAAHELTDADGEPLEVVHRDATPHNVLVGVDGISRIADFGVAKAAVRLTKTMTGVVKGKIAYMAPEQARSGPIDRRCDVWAVGVMAWELFSGKRLHEGLNDFALMLKVTREPPPRLRHVRPDLPLALDAAVAGALCMRTADRYPTAEAFAEALAAAARDAGIDPAAPRAVKAFVNPLVLPAIEQRREQAQKIRRARLGSSPSDLGSSRNSAPPPSDRPSAPAPPAPARPRPSPRTEAPTLTEPLGTTADSGHDQTTLATAVASREPARRHLRTLIAVGAAAGVLLAAVLVLSTNGPRTAPDSPGVAASAVPQPIAPTASASVITPAELPVESESNDIAPSTAEQDDAAITPAELELEQSGGGKAPRRPPVTRPPSTRPPGVVQPEPLANPYKKR